MKIKRTRRAMLAGVITAVLAAIALATTMTRAQAPANAIPRLADGMRWKLEFALPANRSWRLCPVPHP